MRTVVLLPLFCAVIFFHCQFAWSRTVTLVYDDSGSMAGGNRWAYANYGAQTLAALLADGDSLVTISMQEPESAEEEKIIRRQQQETVDSLRKKLLYVKDGPTPFEAVRTALYSSEKGLSQRVVRSKKAGENDWLVIMTDGVFTEINPQKVEAAKRLAITEEIETTIEQWTEATRGEIRVIFFLIGKKADTTIPELWKRISPIDVIHAKANKLSITQKMRETAALITGRDKEPVQLRFTNLKPEEVSFESPFPLSRITVFEQRGEGKLGTLKSLSVNQSHLNVPMLPVELRTSRDLRGDYISGKIHHLVADKPFSSGSYSLDFNNRPEEGDLVVFAEAAVAFDVGLYDKNQQEIKAVNTNVYEVCGDEQFYVRVGFHTTLNNTPVRADEIGSDITVKAIYGDRTQQLQPVKGKSYFQVALTMESVSETLSAEARLPGYFQFKSSILKIKSQVCNKDINIEAKDSNTLAIPFTWSKSMQVVDKFDITVKADNPDGTYSVTVDSLPQGVAVKLQNAILTDRDRSGEVIVDGNQPIQCSVLRNRDFRTQDPQTVHLTFTSENPKVRWLNNRVQFQIQPRPRAINGKVTGTPWSTAVTKIKEAPPLSVSCMVDGASISAEEMDHWTIESAGEGIDFNISPSNNEGVFLLHSSPSAGCACFNKTGTMEHTIILHGPFPGERVEFPVHLEIKNESLWEKCKTLLLTVTVFCVGIFWIFGIIRKPRFKKDACIEYTHGKGRPETVWLASGWAFRWLVPYIPEKKVVEGIEFRPSTSSSSVIVPASQITEEMTVDSVSLLDGDFDKAKDERLYNNSTLEVISGRSSEKYMYRQGL